MVYGLARLVSLGLVLLPSLARAMDREATQAVDLPGDIDSGLFELPDQPEMAAVVGGDAVRSGDWNDVVGLVWNDSVVCTGTLIAPDLVLTAAHCLPGIDSVVVNAPDYRSMFLSAAEREAEQVEVIPVAEEHIYPGGILTIDAGVLVLERQAVYADPRRIARDCIVEDYLEIGADATIVGYGSTETDGGGQTTQLHEAVTRILTDDCSHNEVNGIDTGCNTSVGPGAELGAGGNGVDACFGDSGGPLYLDTPEGVYVAGITSRSFEGIDFNFPCKDGGIYSRADAVVEWVEEVTGETLPRPVCSQPPRARVRDLKVLPGGRDTTRLRITDPDSSEHTFEILRDPAQGTASVDDNGVVTYQANTTFDGDDYLIVRITDGGDADWPDNPPSSTDVRIDVSTGTDCAGCATGGGIGSVGLWGGLALFAWGRRRRESAR